MPRFLQRIIEFGASLALLLVAAGSYANPILIGEHKLCEGVKLKEPKPPGFTITYRSDRNLIEISGSLDIGVTAAFKSALANQPGVNGVLLDSVGGNIYQGRGIAQTIQAHGLDTHVETVCYSACSIAFMAGRHRYISQNGRLGFHGYRLKSGFYSGNIDIDKEQNADLSYFAKYIKDPEFLSKIFATDCDSIWIPTLEELRAVNIVH